MSKDLTDISVWQKSFGLLPIHLSPNSPGDNSYIMLNGGHGDFCLKTSVGEEEYDFNSLAWSSNTKNFLVLENENIIIHNWSKGENETVSMANIEGRFDKFYQYLLTNTHKSEKDIVPFIIDLFKQFRNFTQERNNPVEALNLLFLLLASIDDNIQNLDFNKWNVSNVKLPSNFELYADKLKGGESGLSPKLDVILRHSSGLLFQEAQKEVTYFDRQMDLWGSFSSRIDSKSTLYSSIHYTPPYLARTIVEHALNSVDLSKPNLKILDPACGSGEFLIESLKQLKELDFKGVINILGWDTSETAVNTCNFLLQYEKRTLWQDNLTFSIDQVQDSLTQQWNGDTDLLLMNPPFVSWEQLDKEARNVVRSILPNDSVSKPNQASAFLIKAVQSLNDTGVIGCVIPSTLLTLHAYHLVRRDISDLIDITLIGKLGNFVFEDALTDASMIVGKRPKINSLPILIWTRNEKGIVHDALRDLRKMYHQEQFKVVELDYSIYTPIYFPITKENWKPISFQESEFLKKIDRFVVEGRLVTVKDIFNVKQGIRLGNPIFKLSTTDYNLLPEGEKKYFRAAVDNDSVKRGQLITKNYVWYPYDETGLLINSEQQLSEEVPFYYNNKLLAVRDILSNRARISINDWWCLSEHRAWLREKSIRLVSSEFGRSDSFAIDRTGDFVVERGQGWIPKKEFQDERDFYFYLALFSSRTFDILLSIFSKQLAGGNWFDLGKKYTDLIPVPDINNPDVKESHGYDKLVSIGQELSTGNTYVSSMADEFTRKYFYPEG